MAVHEGEDTFWNCGVDCSARFFVFVHHAVQDAVGFHVVQKEAFCVQLDDDVAS